jgi:peptidyl-prolyl cis-trans isomerase A (cyclophilin A)
MISFLLLLLIFVSVYGRIGGNGNSDEKTASVICSTTKREITIDVYKKWANLGASRFLELVSKGFYTDIPLYRCVEGFLTQFGISDKPEYSFWHGNQIEDDPPNGLGIKKHFVSFAGGGANTRTTQIFIAFEDLDFLGDAPWEVPFGKVVAGNEVLEALYKGYGDIHPYGSGPDQQRLYREGNDYIRKSFPEIDFINSCAISSGDDLDL